jgi:hypothetical protein
VRISRWAEGFGKYVHLSQSEEGALLGAAEAHAFERLGICSEQVEASCGLAHGCEQLLMVLAGPVAHAHVQHVTSDARLH